MKPLDYLKIILRGMSQVMLQNNVITGLLFFIGIFYNSWIMGLGAVLGVIISTVTAVLLNYNKDDIKNGLYGCNGVLVGIGMFFFFSITPLMIAFTIIGAVLSSIIMNFMHTRKLYPYTFPFILSTWILMLITYVFDLIPWQASSTAQAINLDVLSSLSMGFGQVMFQASIITGIIFFIAILINSRRSAVYALIGALIGMLSCFIPLFSLSLVNVGIFGFNGVLSGIAFADKEKNSFIYAIVSIILSVFIIYGMLSFNLIALTSPFVFATWITLGLKRILSKK